MQTTFEPCVTPTRGSRTVVVDTSVAVARMLGDHQLHEPSVQALSGRRVGLAGHAAFETFSVLTRLPSPHRRAPSSVAHALARNFPATVYLSGDAAAQLLGRLQHEDIAGGAVYDALVGAAAVEHRRVLVTADARALSTYRMLNVDYEFIEA